MCSIGILGFVVWSCTQYKLNLLLLTRVKRSFYLHIKNILVHRRLSFSGLPQSLNPYFVTGFCDGESYFNVALVKNPKLKAGWSVKLSFGINLHKKDEALLEKLKVYFNYIGVVADREQDVIKFTVSSLTDLETIINHFDSYPLISQKWSDYQLFKQAFELVKCKNHLTQSGLKEIVGIKASLNKGLSEVLNAAFPDVIPVFRPPVVALAHFFLVIYLW